MSLENMKSQLPSGWELRSLAEACLLLTDGSHFSPSTIAVGYPYITVRDINDSKIDFVNCKFVSKESFDELSKNGCQPLKGDVLFSKDGTVGKVALVEDERDFVVLSSLAIMRPKKELLHSEFLKWVLQSPAVLESALGMKSGTALRRVVLRSLKTLQLPIPPLTEQDEIVRILEEQCSRLDAAAAAIAAVRRKADQFRRSLLYAAFTGALTGADLSWPVERLGSVCKVVSGATPKTSVSAYWDGDIPWLTPNDLSKNRSKVVSAGERAITKAGFDSCSTQMVPAGTVLFTSRAPIGYVAIAGAPLCTNQGFKSAIPNDRLLSDYLFWQLQALTEDIRSRASGTTFLEISAKGFSATEVVVPSLEVQRQVVDVIESQIDRYEGIIHAVKTLDNRIAAMRRSLLHAAFSGELTKEWREKNNG